MRMTAIVLVLVLVAAPLTAQNTANQIYTSSTWCQDTGTVCWNEGRDWFNGVRIVAEFDLGFIFDNGDNRLESGSAKTLPKFALEFNIYRAWASLQLGIFTPGSARVDELSPLLDTVAVNGGRHAKASDATLDYDWGWFAGLTTLDGALAFGYGNISYDARQFDRVNFRRCASGVTSTTTCLADDDFAEGFQFFAVQPVSTLRSSIKGQKEAGGN